MVKIHQAGKTTKKRQNYDTSKSPAHTQHPPCHIKQRNKEGTFATRNQLLPCWENTR
jgi:hypothetical protein